MARTTTKKALAFNSKITKKPAAAKALAKPAEKEDKAKKTREKQVLRKPAGKAGKKRRGSLEFLDWAAEPKQAKSSDKEGEEKMVTMMSHR